VTALYYNGLNQLQYIDFPGGLRRTNTYFASGSYANWLQSVQDLPINRADSFNYGADGLISDWTDPRGLHTVNTWDKLQRLTSVKFPDQTYLTNLYYRLDRTASRDRLTNWTYYQYDGSRRLITVTNALNKVTHYTYCSCFALATITNALQKVTQFSYDNANRLYFAQNDDSSISYSLDLLGRITSTSISGSTPTYSYYTAQSLPALANNATGQVFSVVYDKRDRSSLLTNSVGVAFSNNFDNLGRLLTRTWLQTNASESYSYTTNGLANYTDRLANTNRFARDAARRLLFVTNANQQVTSFTYNPAGDLLTLLDGKQQQTAWNYDAYGQVTNKLNALNTQVAAFTYDPNGQLTNRWSAAKGNTAYRYDAVGNLTNVIYPANSGSPASLVMAYDAVDRMTNLVDAVGTSQFTYTSSGLLLTEDGPWASDTVTLSYATDLRYSLTLQHPTSASWTEMYSFDFVRRLQTLSSPAGNFTYNYPPPNSATPTANGLWNNLTFPNTTYRTNTYDPLARLQETDLDNSAGNWITRWFNSYNAGDQRTSTTRSDDNGKTTRTFLYDRIGQLTNVATASDFFGPPPLEQSAYAYDGAGNLTNRVKNALVQRFNTDSLNQLSTVSNSGTLSVGGYTTTNVCAVAVNGLAATLYAYNTYAVAGLPLVAGTNTLTAIAQDTLWRRNTNIVTAYWPATATFQYDANGNLVWDGKKRLDYDADNQLITVTFTNTVQSKFVYDGLSRLRIRREYSWQTNQWKLTNEVRYIYDHNLVIQERDSNNVPKLTYTRGLDLGRGFQRAGGIGGLLAMTQNGSTNHHFYYDNDGAGNVTGLFDTNLNQVAYYLYDPFGNTIFAIGPMANVNAYRFSSKEFHANSGLTYFGRRFYDPNLQRWLSQDPIGEAGGVNLYRFVRNSPLAFVDRSGLDVYPIGFTGPIQPGDSYIGNGTILTLQPDGSFLIAAIENESNQGLEDDPVVTMLLPGGGLYMSGGLGGLGEACFQRSAKEAAELAARKAAREAAEAAERRLSELRTLYKERQALQKALEQDHEALQNAKNLIEKLRRSGGPANPYGLVKDAESFSEGIAAKQARLDQIAQEIKDIE